MINEFNLVLIVLPILTFVISVIGQRFIKRKFIVIGIVFAIYMIATFTVFNSSFLLWAVIYTVIAWISTTLTDYIKKLT